MEIKEPPNREADKTALLVLYSLEGLSVAATAVVAAFYFSQV